MRTKKATIETTLRALEKAEPQIAEVAARIREAVGPGPRNAFELAALRGLRLVQRGDDHQVRLEGSSIVFGSQGLSDDAVLRAVARWELRSISEDEASVLMLRDMLQELYSDRSVEDRRRDGRVLLAAQRAALDSLERDMAEKLARARRHADQAEAWLNGGPIPPDARRFARLVDATQELACTCPSKGANSCTACLANNAISEFWSLFDLEDPSLTVFDWALGRNLDRNLDTALEVLWNCESLKGVSWSVYDAMDAALAAARAAEGLVDTEAA